jgi:hypothetical protein
MNFYPKNPSLFYNLPQVGTGSPQLKGFQPWKVVIMIFGKRTYLGR